eukprot:c46837_g1_i1.p2 GENE.c46837_g1_i1~~c46837_g1_i1.p2  ORF type:complete len:201 (-),score=46.10 c46837_g1_i1:42-644(-)
MATASAATAAAMEEDRLEILQERLASLGRKIAGVSFDSDGRLIRKSLDSLCSSVAAMTKELSDIVRSPGNGSVQVLFDQYLAAEAQKLVGDESSDSVLWLSFEAKLALVEAFADSVDGCCAQLTEIARLKGAINDDALARVPLLTTKLAPLEARLVEQAAAVAAMQERTHAVLLRYNDVMSLVSQKMVAYDAALREAGAP